MRGFTQPNACYIIYYSVTEGGVWKVEVTEQEGPEVTGEPQNTKITVEIFRCERQRITSTRVMVNQLFEEHERAGMRTVFRKLSE